jgi:hypothetical protein
MTYQIVVPTYKRYEVLNTQTLSTLNKLQVDKNRIHIFVANEEELEKYKSVCGDEYRYVVGIPGIGGQRKLINNYFGDKEKIFCIDDDLKSVMVKGEKKLQPIDMSLDEIVEMGYYWAEKYGARIWGANHTFNNFYLKDEISVGLKYICAAFMGTYGNDWIWQDSERPIVNTGEDHHTSLRAFVRYGSVVRFEYICFDTPTFTAGSNTAATLERDGVPRMIKHEENLKKVAERYPDLAKVRYLKDTGNPTMRFKPVSIARIKRENARPWLAL